MSLLPNREQNHFNAEPFHDCGNRVSLDVRHKFDLHSYMTRHDSALIFHIMLFITAKDQPLLHVSSERHSFACSLALHWKTEYMK